MSTQYRRIGNKPKSKLTANSMCQSKIDVATTNQVERAKKNHNNEPQLDPINEITGQYGLYHLNLSLFIILREATTAIDSFVFSLSMPTLQNFQCVSAPASLDSDSGLDPRCYYQHNKTATIEQCQEWQYEDDQFKDTLSVQYDLVCDRKWHGSMVLSAYFVGWLFGSFLWGPLADKLGRRTHALSHVSSLLFGAGSLVAPNIYILMFFRFATALSTLGYCTLNTLQVEITGTRWRSYITTANHFGWGLGVVLVCFIARWTNNWLYLAAISPAYLLISLPWIFTLPESIRWLLLNKRYSAARKEIKRSSAINGLKHNCTDHKIDLLFAAKKLELEMEATNTKEAQFWYLFTKWSLMCNLIPLWCAYMCTSFIYFSRTIEFEDNVESMTASFLTTGIGEWVSLGIATVNLFLFKRKTCVAMFLYICSLAYVTEGYLATHQQELFASTGKLRYSLDALAKLASLSSSTCLLLMSIEVFPTELRNSGSALVYTGSSLGSSLAPFQRQMESLAGNRFLYSVGLASLITLTSTLMLVCARETKNTKLIERTREKCDDPPSQYLSRLENHHATTTVRDNHDGNL